MSEEEIIQKKLDRLNQNSHYGLETLEDYAEYNEYCREEEIKRLKEAIDNDVFHSVSMVMNVDQAEIAKIVHDYLERGIVSDYDRLNCPKPPIYIGPIKVKTLKERLEEATMHADCEFCVKRNICTRDVPKPCRYRYTEEERIADQASDMFGNILHKTYLHPTFRKKKEESKMEPTSVWKIENIDNIWITQDVDGMSLMLKNKDDFTKIMLSGDAIDNYNDTFVIALKEENEKTMYEQDQKIRELEKELGRWKKEAADCLKLRDEAQKEAYKLKKDNEKLEELKTPTIENFEELSDNVNHPSHYTGKYECIDVMQDVFGDEATDNFCLCNAFKYIWRARKKNGLEDVKKAVWYLNKYIEEAEKDGEDKVTGA